MNTPQTSRLREHASAAAFGAFVTVCVAAMVTVIGWCLYLPGWVNADLFVMILRVAIAFAVGGVVIGIPLSIAVDTLLDRLRGKGKQ